VLFRTDQAIEPEEREQYERAISPVHTDWINETLIGRDPMTDHSPLGDPIPFSAYLMGRLLDPDGGYNVDFNLDADRGYGYLSWDWIRGAATGKDQRGDTYHQPIAQPEGSKTWPGAAPDAVQDPIRLRYFLQNVDRIAREWPRGERIAPAERVEVSDREAGQGGPPR
jgi:hypothetical protein